MDSEPVRIQVGVLLPPSGPLGHEDRDPDDFDDDGYAKASGRRDAARSRQIARRGEEVLHAAAEAIGQQIGLVVGGVLAGIQQNGNGAMATALAGSSFEIQDVGLKFGVKTTLGVGKAVEAFFTASGEATVEVTLTLRQPGAEPVP